MFDESRGDVTKNHWCFAQGECSSNRLGAASRFEDNTHAQESHRLRATRNPQGPSYPCHPKSHTAQRTAVSPSPLHQFAFMLDPSRRVVSGMRPDASPAACGRAAAACEWCPDALASQAENDSSFLAAQPLARLFPVPGLGSRGG